MGRSYCGEACVWGKRLACHWGFKASWMLAPRSRARHHLKPSFYGRFSQIARRFFLFSSRFFACIKVHMLATIRGTVMTRSTVATLERALSIRQPWATLVVLGLKTIEIRRWSTPLRGRIYLHAGKIPDDRREGWSRIPEEHFALTSRCGGIIGAVDIVDCVTYATARDFARHRQLHFNEQAWFVAPRLYGFRFENPEFVPFRRCPGQVKFFPVTMAHAALPMAPPALGKKRVAFELNTAMAASLGAKSNRSARTSP
jgi:hypothetical protein